MLEVSPTGRGVLSVDGEDAVAGFVVDQVGSWWSERLARALAPLQDGRPPPAEHREPPEGVRIGDLLERDPTDPESVRRGWTSPTRGPTAALGATTVGPWVVDLRRDGPHVLVGGTTGAGKSELLQCLVAGLAVSLPPDELAFVLIDYKGGSAFAACRDLPHTVGLVTDLDEHLTARALASLRAELVRRERLLALVGARDLDDYASGGAPAATPCSSASSSSSTSSVSSPRTCLRS